MASSEDLVVIDFHIHAKSKGRPIVHEILQEMRRNGVTQAVLLGRDTDPHDLDIPEKKRGLVAGLMGTSEVLHGRNTIADILETIRGELSRSITNQETADFVKVDPSRLVGIGSINPSKGEEYVSSKLDEVYALGLVGLKFYPPTQFFNPGESEPLRSLCERVRRRRKILVFHTGFMPGIWESPLMSKDANPRCLEPLAKEFDSIPFVLAHFGAYSAATPGVWFNEAVELGERCRNVWFDISAVPYVVTERHLIEKAKKRVGIDRILFGSDGLDYIGFTLEAVLGTPYLNEEEKRRVLGLNALDLLSIVSP